MTARLAVYTTIYPGVEAYLRDWHRSLLGQSDQDFSLWIGLDRLPAEAAMRALGADPGATWVEAAPGDTPARLRERALERIVESCDGVVLVDSDDLLHPSRIAGAREALRSSDLTACALRLVDHAGLDLGHILTLPPAMSPETLLPRHNVFGFSNSAFRTAALRECLPIPSTVLLVDWFLATRAWLRGDKLGFDRAIRMDYRQHDANMTQVRPPFSGSQVTRDTARVLDHLREVLASLPAGALRGRLVELERMAADVEVFHRRTVLDPARLERYVQALEALPFVPLWWSSVAHPELRHMWIH